jgi:DNA-directed RNA polymerase specialized sigma24 family protein
MQAFEEILRAGKRDTYSFAYMRKAAINNFVGEKNREKTRHGGQVPYRLDDPDHDWCAGGAEDPRLSEWENERWRADILSELPPRQGEVMKRVAAGLGNREIAQELDLSDAVVRRRRCDALRSSRNILLPDGEYRQGTSTASVQRRGVNRAVDRAMAISASLTASPCDLRAMSPAEREETTVHVGELLELLRRYPARSFGSDGSAMILANVATLATARTADRDEWGALKLTRTANPHLAFVGDHPAAFELRRAHAEALCELGMRKGARSLLRALSEAERRVLGAPDPRTVMLLLWSQAMTGQFREAEQGFRELEKRLALSRDPGTAMLLLHVQCRRYWLRGKGGQLGESAGGYVQVTLNRSRMLGSDDSDTLDGGHSLGKMLVVSGAGAQAIPILQGIADDRARVQGDRHADTLESLKYLLLARVQAEPRDDRVLNDAIVCLEQILRIQVSRYGACHPMSSDTASYLNSLRKQLTER